LWATVTNVAIAATTVTGIGTIITAVASTMDMVRASNCISAATVTATIGGTIITINLALCERESAFPDQGSRPFFCVDFFSAAHSLHSSLALDPSTTGLRCYGEVDPNKLFVRINSTNAKAKRRGWCDPARLVVCTNFPRSASHAPSRKAAATKFAAGAHLSINPQQTQQKH
jgi:hypothetical protein